MWQVPPASVDVGTVTTLVFAFADTYIAGKKGEIGRKLKELVQR